MTMGGSSPDQSPGGELPPRRIQLSRAKGWRMPPNTVKVDRTTRWGNPYREGDTRSPEGFPFAPNAGPLDRAGAVRQFRALTADRLNRDPLFLAELHGKNLACWCKPGEPCHADVLLELANR